MNISSKQPKRHHYVPQFLLSRWGREDGRIYTHRRSPEGALFETWLMPREVGAQNHLWSLSQYHKERGIIESGFFSSIDSKAAEVLEKLQQRNRLDDSERVEWALFILSLMIRSPATIEHIKTTMPQEVMDYAKQNAPYGLLQNLELMPGYLEDVALSLSMLLTQDRRMLETILDMDWAIRYLPETNHRFLISDRLVTRMFSVSDPRCLLAFPISPVSCFVATKNNLLIAKLMEMSNREFAMAINKNAAALAHSFVVGDCQKSFLERHFLPSKGKS